LELLSVGIGDFTTAGGIIIFLIGLKMVLEPSSSAASSAPPSKEELRALGSCRQPLRYWLDPE
jgi:small neutral amino acid transporter SnatA (MarC family)